jgi:membrane fusion protein, multidrug efflux system
MSVVRTVVLPTLRLMVWAVIAVALAVLALRGGSGDPGVGVAGPGAPTLDLSSPPVPVARGSIANTVSVTGTVVADAAVPVKATAAGSVRRLIVARGATVTAGQPLLEIRYEQEQEQEPVAARAATWKGTRRRPRDLRWSVPPRSRHPPRGR